MRLSQRTKQRKFLWFKANLQILNETVFQLKPRAYEFSSLAGSYFFSKLEKNVFLRQTAYCCSARPALPGSMATRRPLNTETKTQRVCQ